MNQRMMRLVGGVSAALLLLTGCGSGGNEGGGNETPSAPQETKPTVVLTEAQRKDKLEQLLAWPDGKKWALTFSYDDGSPYDPALVDIFNQYGMKGTFNLIGQKVQTGNWSVHFTQVAAQYEGHEVANHTWTHPYLAQVDKQTQINEIQQAKDFLEMLVEYPVRGMAYPYGTAHATAEVIDSAKQCGVVYARTTTSTRSFDVPTDFMRWHATLTNTAGEAVLNSTFEQFIAQDRGMYHNLYYLWGHSFEFAPDKGGYGIIENFCAKAAAQKDKIWFATNIDIYDYVQATYQVTLSADGTTVTNGAQVPVWLRRGEQVIRIEAGQSHVLA